MLSQFTRPTGLHVAGRPVLLTDRCRTPTDRLPTAERPAGALGCRGRACTAHLVQSVHSFLAGAAAPKGRGEDGAQEREIERATERVLGETRLHCPQLFERPPAVLRQRVLHSPQRWFISRRSSVAAGLWGMEGPSDVMAVACRTSEKHPSDAKQPTSVRRVGHSVNQRRPSPGEVTPDNFAGRLPLLLLIPLDSPRLFSPSIPLLSL